MLLNVREILLGFAFSLFLLPMVAFASTEFKGTETVNINKANAATLAAYLKGIGPNKAEAIVKFRKSNGSFKSAADIKNVPGVGDETYKDIKSKISTSRGKSVAPKGYKLGETSGKSKSTKKKATAKKSTSSSSSSTAKKSSTSKSTSSKAKKTASTKKASSAKKTSTEKTEAK
ncbi:MAG: competence protein ComEA, partial [Cocleimonas sp.]